MLDTISATAQMYCVFLYPSITASIVHQRQDGGVGHPLVRPDGLEVVELGEAAATLLDFCRTFSAIAHVQLAEAVHALRSVCDTLEGVVTDVLELLVGLAHLCSDYPLDCLQIRLGVLGRDEFTRDRLAIRTVIDLVAYFSGRTVHFLVHFCHKA